MFNITNGSATLEFKNGYRVVIHSVENTGDMQVFLKDNDVTNHFCDSGIIKYAGKKMSADQIIKVCNIIKNIHENGNNVLMIGGQIFRC